MHVHLSTQDGVFKWKLISVDAHDGLAPFKETN
jgi:hypothetical protein